MAIRTKNRLAARAVLLRPPPRMALSEWADRHYRLSSISSASAGKWRTLPYQKGVLDAITDPAVKRVSVQKSARIGYTKMINVAIAFHTAYDPTTMLAVQPTVGDAEGFSKEEIAPMLEEVPVLAGLVAKAKPGKKAKSADTSEQTILHKKFRGGAVLRMTGAESPRGFRRISARIVIFDEVDGYTLSCGNEGDPIALGEKRASAYWNPKIIAGSTPTITGLSRIEKMFHAGDQRRYYVPHLDPACGHMDFLRFSQSGTSGGTDDDPAPAGGHWMCFKDGPETAHFVCSKCGGEIPESDKYAMLEAGEWRAAKPFDPIERHVSFHIWAAYSTNPGASWSTIAAEFLKVKHDPNQLKTFIQTVVGETWKQRGDAPKWERLYDRREHYKIGTVPDGVIALTCGVDVQKDRLVFEVVGWESNGKTSHSIEAGELLGDTADEATWLQLEELLNRDFGGHQIRMMAVDSGWNTQMVYNWIDTHRWTQRVMAVKGAKELMAPLLGAASPVDIDYRGKRKQKGLKLWPVGGHAAKQELYGWLEMRIAEGCDPPAGYCHFPEYGEEFFQQLTAEHLVPHREGGRNVARYEVDGNQPNHYLDCRVYARAAAVHLKIHTWVSRGYVPQAPAPAAPATPAAPAALQVPVSPPPPPPPPPRSGGIFGGSVWGAGRRGAW